MQTQSNIGFPVIKYAFLTWAAQATKRLANVARFRYLDQANINNAYVSGMKEDLDLKGNELNLYVSYSCVRPGTANTSERFTTYFNVAYCIMLIPSQIIMTYVRPSWWLPSVEIVWGIITGLIAITHNAKQVYVLRAFLGLCESAAYPGMITLFSKLEKCSFMETPR